MTQQELAPATHSTLRSLAMLWRFYYPTLNRQLLYYPLVVPIVLGVHCLYALVTHHAGILLFPWIFSIMIYFAPFALTRRDNRFISSMLPVTAGDKLLFLLLYFLIVPQLLIYIPQLVICRFLIWGGNPDLVRVAESYLWPYHNNMSYAIIVWRLSTSAFVIAAIYGIVTHKANRGLNMVKWVGCMYLAYIFVAAFVGAVIGIMLAKNNPEVLISSQPEFEIATSSNVFNITMGLLSLLVGVAIILVIRLYKKLRNCGF